jgi:ubiquinone/menaquinone biosynthesis C-methylase UbiE
MHGSTNDVEHFDRWAPTYDAFWGQRYVDRMHGLMLESVAGSGAGVPSAVLDVGCGTGRLLEKAGGLWPTARLLGVDPAPGMIEVARRRIPQATIEVAGAEALPLPDASVDLVLTCVSLHHWKDRGQGLREAARVLRPGGQLCLADITVPAWVSRLFHRIKAASPDTLHSLLTQAGFRVEKRSFTMARMVCLVLAVKPGSHARRDLRTATGSFAES